jgi:hypothetical protein
MWISSKHQYFIGATLAPKVANWHPKLIDTLFFFFSLGQSQGHKSGRLKKNCLFSALTPGVKPRGLISRIAPIRVLHLSSNLALTPSVK